MNRKVFIRAAAVFQSVLLMFTSIPAWVYASDDITAQTPGETEVQDIPEAGAESQESDTGTVIQDDSENTEETGLPDESNAAETEEIPETPEENENAVSEEENTAIADEDDPEGISAEGGETVSEEADAVPVTENAESEASDNRETVAEEAAENQEEISEEITEEYETLESGGVILEGLTLCLRNGEIPVVLTLPEFNDFFPESYSGSAGGLQVTAYPSPISPEAEQRVRWTTSDPEVVTLDVQGNTVYLRTRRRGTATVTASVTDDNENRFETSFQVNVEQWIWLETPEIIISPDETKTLSFEVRGAAVGAESIHVYSDNEEAVTIPEEAAGSEILYDDMGAPYRRFTVDVKAEKSGIAHVHADLKNVATEEITMDYGNVFEIYVSDASKPITKLTAMMYDDAAGEEVPISGQTLQGQPDWEWNVSVSAEPLGGDYAGITWTSSNEELVRVEPDETVPARAKIRAAFWGEDGNPDPEGTATITVSYGTGKQAVRDSFNVQIQKWIITDKNNTNLTYVEDAEEQGFTDVTVTVRGMAAGQEPVPVLYYREWVQDGENDWQGYHKDSEPGSGDMYLSVEKISGDVNSNRFTYRITPKQLLTNERDVAEVRFEAYWDQDRHDFMCSGSVWVFIQGLKRIEWRDWVLNDLHDGGRVWRNNDNFRLETDGAEDTDIYYSVVYTPAGEEPPADLNDDEQRQKAEELKASGTVYQQKVTIDSPYYVTDENGPSYATIYAIAVKQGMMDSPLLKADLRVENWLDVDEVFARYIEDNNLTIDDIRDQIFVFHGWEGDYDAGYGIPGEVAYTGEKITFDNDDRMMRVYYGTRRLEKGVDYTVTYANNVNAADKDANVKGKSTAPSVTIKGKGDYSGSWTQTFTISKRHLSQWDNNWGCGVRITSPEFMTITTKKTTDKVHPNVTLKLRKPSGKEASLKEGTDYTLLYYPTFSEEDEIRFGEPLTQIDGSTASYRIVVVGVESSKNFKGDTAEIISSIPEQGYTKDDGGMIYSIAEYFDYVHAPILDVFCEADRMIVDMKGAKLSKSMPAQPFKGCPEGTVDEGGNPLPAGFCDYLDLQRYFIGENPEIVVKIGSRTLTCAPVVFDDEGRLVGIGEGDFFVQEFRYAAGTQTYVLIGLDRETVNGEPTVPVVGAKEFTFKVTPQFKLSAKDIVIENLASSIALDEPEHINLYNENGLDISKLAVDPTKPIVLKTKATKNAESVTVAEFYPGEEQPFSCWAHLEKYNGRAGKINVVFEGDDNFGITGTIRKTLTIGPTDIAGLYAGNTEDQEIIHVEFRDNNEQMQRRLRAINGISDDSIFLAQYSASGSKPKLWIRWNVRDEWWHDLQEGTDYTVSYKNNKKVTNGEASAQVTIKFKGNYKGTITKTFAIVPSDFTFMHWGESALTAKAADKVYNEKGKADYFKSEPEIYDGTKKLKKGSDYKVISNSLEFWYEENFYENGRIIHSMGEPIPDGSVVPAGAVIHVAEDIEILNKNYGCHDEWGNEPEDNADIVTTRRVDCSYRMVENAYKISSAKVVVNPDPDTGKPLPVYLGENWEVVPKLKVTVGSAKNGTLAELSENDYVIEEITNNWRRGKATMVIRGKGKYWGTKKVTFSITSTPLTNQNEDEKRSWIPGWITSFFGI